MNCRRRTDAPIPKGRVQADNAKAKGTLYQGVAPGNSDKPNEYKEVPQTPTTQPMILRYHSDD